MMDDMDDTEEGQYRDEEYAHLYTHTPDTPPAWECLPMADGASVFYCAACGRPVSRTTHTGSVARLYSPREGRWVALRFCAVCTGPDQRRVIERIEEEINRERKEVKRAVEAKREKLEHCRSCGAEILWLQNSTTGKAAPINYEPEPPGVGNIVANIENGTYRIADKKERAAQSLRTSHFVTCPQARRWERRNK